MNSETGIPMPIALAIVNILSTNSLSTITATSAVNPRNQFPSS